ncbi:hypothetical protein N7447_002016, partial [Penicillium robsamsonii]|uniref:uncharacterized protein n=1 Tax=Penicillium robsamsonii TaxID=1792511 RepID=UPI0025491579
KSRAQHPAQSFRRYSRACYLALFAVISLFILSRVLNRQDYLLQISSDSRPNTRPSRSIVIRPGDIVSKISREVRPRDDRAPFAHEPTGLGTLRDVREDEFYRGGTLTVTREDDNYPPIPIIYDPYPKYNSREWRKEFVGSFRACEGPRGKTLSRRSAQDMISVYPGIQKNFPSALLGSYLATGVDGNVCTDRSSRLGVYGYESNTSHASSASEVNLDETNWGSLQSQCFERNVERYSPSKADSRSIQLTLPVRSRYFARMPPRDRPASLPRSLPQYKTRSAVVLRAWHGMAWTEDLKQNVRSLVMELSLHSGAEYEVFILCHVKDETIPIYTGDIQDMDNIKAEFVPREFMDMTILFNDKTLESWYPKIDEHRTYYQYWQPVQIFSQIFSNFDYYWQLEMNSRFTGHSYHFLEKSAEFAKAQPRKYLWERNAYFYIPGEHGIWKNFLKKIESAMENRKSVWGPRSIPQITPIGPKPPVAFPEDDKYEWGVGEEADLITFLPIFNPIDTKWLFRDMLWELPEDVPRRASHVAIGRISRSLLHEMHVVQIQRGMGIVSEMTAPSLALWHGLKAVHVPHALYVDGKWTSKELGRILNTGEPDNINGGTDSIWNLDHRLDHILYRLSYMLKSQTAGNFYRRWLGYPIDPEQYTDGSHHQDRQGRNWFETGDLREDLYGPLCFPSMFLLFKKR